jgi:hypothetical protein
MDRRLRSPPEMPREATLPTCVFDDFVSPSSAISRSTLSSICAASVSRTVISE